ncbi:MAG: flagellar protein FlaJ [Candidatus Woesearchaeota archaeon]|jgi:flagellar protein FlaJ
MSDKPFLMVLPLSLNKKLAFLFRGFALKIQRSDKQFAHNLKKLDMDIDEEDYLTYAMPSYILLSLFAGFAIFYVLFTNPAYETWRAILIGGLAILLSFGGLLYLSLKHPNSTATVKAGLIDMYLGYALNDLILELNSGKTIHSAMVSVSEANYGQASVEFRKVVKEANVGRPIFDVIRKQIALTHSEYLKKTYWQLLNSIKAGSDLKKGLGSIASELTNDQHTKIENYGRELNLWSLLYMLFAVAIPTIGSTMLVILSSFAGYGITKGTFIIFLILSSFMQLGLIHFVKSRRPLVHF